MKDEILEIIKKFTEWKKENPNEDYQYDCVYDFVDGVLTRGELLTLFNWLETKEK